MQGDNTRKKQHIGVHIAAWLGLYLVWIFVFQNHTFTFSRTMTVEFCYLIFITIDYYILIYFLFPHFLKQKKYVYLATGILVLIAGSALLRALLAVQMNMHVFHTPVIAGFKTLYLNSIINIALWVLLLVTAKTIYDRVQTQQQLEALEKERVKNELDYLKAQINPHALFNSLNTIYGHINKNNQTARNILLQFSDLLRYQLYYCSSEKVSLEKEMEYIKNYIAFQKLRKDGELVVSVEMGNFPPELTIAPLLLIVLIENAFKYVSNHPDFENAISIKIYPRGKSLHSSFYNTKDTALLPPGGSNGIGISNLKRRLQLLYSDKYDFRITDNGNSYETHLTIDLS